MSIVVADNIESYSGFPNYTLVKAWTSYKTLTTFEIFGSMGISSIINLSTGQSRIIFNNSFPDNSYAMTLSGQRDSSNVNEYPIGYGFYNWRTENISVLTQDNDSNANRDCTEQSITVSY